MTSQAANKEMVNRRTSEEEERDGFYFRCKQTFSIFTKYVVVRSFGLGVYVLDMLTDVYAACDDYKAGDVNFAYATIGLVFAPGVLFSLYLFCVYFIRYIGEIACLKALLWILTSPFLPVWVVLKDFKQILEGVIATFCPAKRSNLIEKLSQPSRAYLLKFLEGFTEAAPQLLLRLFRVARRSPRQFSDLRSSEIIQICFSLFTLSLKIVSTHQQSVSTQQIIDGDAEIDSKLSLPWYLQIVALLWWICFLISRFEALALFCSSYGNWILLIIGIHIVLIFIFQTIADRKDGVQRIFIYLFGAFVFIFAYVQFNLKTRLKIAVWFPYTIFTIVVFVENCVMMTFWYFDQRKSLEAVKLMSLNSSYINSIISPLSTNTTNIEYDNYLDDLQSYWKLLLFLHFGVFGIGLVFMIVLFTSASLCRNDQTAEIKEREEAAEMQNLMRAN